MLFFIFIPSILKRHLPSMSKFKELKSRWNIKSNFQFFIIFCVFAITGSTAAVIAKPILGVIGITKESVSLWLYYPLYILIIYPFYKILLLFYGALFGQLPFFWNIAKKLFLKMGFKFLVVFIEKNTKLGQ